MEPTPPRGSQAHLPDNEILDLAHGLPPTDRIAEAVAHLQECARCEERLRYLAGERERLLAGPRPLWSIQGIQLGGTADDDPAALRPDPPVASRRAHFFSLPLIGLGLAAAAALALVLILRPHAPPRRGAYWFPPITEEALRSDIGTLAATPELAAALRAYERQDMTDALARFRALPASLGSDYFDTVRSLYLASLLTLHGEDAEARRTLDGVDINSLPEPWRGRARYVLQQVLRHEGRVAEADSLLRFLSEQTGEVSDRARRDLER